MDTTLLIEEALKTFRPKFRSLDDDAINLANHARKVARGKVPDADALRFPALALGRGAAFDRLVDYFLEHGRADLVEADCKIDEWGRALPDRNLRARIRRFAEIGEGPRALRCWQHYIRKNAMMFWQDVRDRAAAEKKMKKGAVHPGELELIQESFHTSRRVVLESIALADRYFAAHGTEREIAWLNRTRDEVHAGQRSSIATKPLPDAMDEDLFWRLVETGGATTDDRLDTLPDRLAAYGAPAIKAFGQMATDRVAEAYREDIWALAYLLMDGCSDDAFEYFRNWLVLQGRTTFDAVLRNPDGFDPAALTEKPLTEGLMPAVEQAFVLRAGKDMPRLRQPKSKRIAVREDSFPTLLPNVVRRLS